MKAKIKITIMLMAMIIGSLAASGQSAKRGTPHNEQNRKTLRNLDSESDRPEHRKTSISNHENPRSDYRAPNRTVHAGKTYMDPKTRQTSEVHRPAPVEKKYVNSNLHRRYYPAKRVKIRVHPVTYHNHYRALYYPAHRNIIWTHRMNRYYSGLYPGSTYRYPIGYHIETISAFEARYNVGEVTRVYGRVYATWHNRETDDFLLFFGGGFPNQEFTMVIPGNIARRYNWRPERYFLGQHVFATGLISSFEGRPELIVKKRSQLDVY